MNIITTVALLKSTRDFIFSNSLKQIGTNLIKLVYWYLLFSIWHTYYSIYIQGQI